MADMLYTNLPNFSRFSPLSLPLNLFPHTNCSFIRVAPLRRRFSLSSPVAKFSSDSSQFDIISKTELADGSVSFKFGDASDISEIVDKFDGGNDVELERESDDSLGREANDVTDDDSDGSKADNFVRNSFELKKNAVSVVDLQSDVQICENSVEDEQNSNLISTAGVEDSSDFDATRHESRVGNGAVVICDSSVGVTIEKVGELSDDDELEHGGDVSSNIGGASVVVSLEDEIVKDEIAKDEIVKDEIVKDEIVEDEVVSPEKDEIVKDEIVEDEVMSPEDGNEIVENDIVEDGIEEDKVVSSDDETVKDDIVEDEIVKDDIVEDEIVKDGIVEEDFVKDETVKNEIVKGEFIEDEIVKGEIVEGEIMENEMVEDEIVKDDFVKDDIVENEIEVDKGQKVVSLDYEIVKDVIEKDEIVKDEEEEIVEDEIVKDAIVKDETGDYVELSLEDEIKEDMVVSLEDETEKASVFAVSHPISMDEDDDSVELMSKKFEAEPILDEETSFDSLDDVVALGSSLRSNKVADAASPATGQSDGGPPASDILETTGPEASGIHLAESNLDSVNVDVSTRTVSVSSAAASLSLSLEVTEVGHSSIASLDDDPRTHDISDAAPPGIVASGITSTETIFDRVNSLNSEDVSSSAATLPLFSESDDDQHCNDSSKAVGPDPKTSGIASAEVSINRSQQLQIPLQQLLHLHQIPQRFMIPRLISLHNLMMILLILW